MINNDKTGEKLLWYQRLNTLETPKTYWRLGWAWESQAQGSLGFRETRPARRSGGLLSAWSATPTRSLVIVECQTVLSLTQVASDSTNTHPLHYSWLSSSSLFSASHPLQSAWTTPNRQNSGPCVAQFSSQTAQAFASFALIPRMDCRLFSLIFFEKKIENKSSTYLAAHWQFLWVSALEIHEEDQRSRDKNRVQIGTVGVG